MAEKGKNDELIIEAKSFFEANKKELGASLRKDAKVIYVDFIKLTEFNTCTCGWRSRSLLPLRNPALGRS